MVVLLFSGERSERIQAGMVADGTLGEIITGLLGVPYVEVGPMLDLLANGNPYGSAQYEFTKYARRIRGLEKRLSEAQSDIVRSLSKHIMIRQGLPPNAKNLALQDAKNRLAKLP
jgi:hypothetical protein